MKQHTRRMYRFTRSLLRLLLLATLLTGFSGAAPQPVLAQAGGQMVLEIFTPPGVTLPMRSGPALGNPVVRSFGNGNRLLWDGQVVLGDGRNWMHVSALGLDGWMSPDEGQMYLANPTQITRGIDRGTIIAPYTNPMTLYRTPGRGSDVVLTLPVGTQLRVTDGPRVTDLYTWWPVQVLGGVATGWVVDTARELQVIAPLVVYGYQVCDNFDLRNFGAVGWDSVRFVFPSVIPANEAVVCLASTRLRGNATPIVVVLTRATSAGATFDVLRLFEQIGGAWTVIYQQASELGGTTEHLGLHQFAAGDRPMLLWTTRMEGTGHILDVNVLRYTPAGIAILLDVQPYKGYMQVSPGEIVIIEADYLPGEPNCCPTGIHRYVYTWSGTQFLPIINDILPSPSAFQARR